MEQEGCPGRWDMQAVNACIANACSGRFEHLYCVNMETDEYAEYSPDGIPVRLKFGSGFFALCEAVMHSCVSEEDQAAFSAVMNHSFFSSAMKEKRTVSLTVRMRKNGREGFREIVLCPSLPENNLISVAVSDIDELAGLRKEQAQMKEELLIYARLQAISSDFICVYVVDPDRETYHEFSASEIYSESMDQAKTGTNFFNTVRTAALNFNHPDDLDRFLSEFTRQNVLAEIEKNGLFTLEYRFQMNGHYIHVALKAAIVKEAEGARLIVGLCDTDAQHRQKEISQEIERQKEVYDQITASLAEQYDTLYYIDLETGTYHEISSTDEYKKLNVPATGNDFFAESRRSIRKYVHPEDQEKIIRIHYRDSMLENLKNRNSFSIAYRLVVDGQVRHIRHTEIMARDRRHIIVCIENIDLEVQAQLALKESQKRSVTYTQIAETLADHYDMIYYIDCETLNYAEFTAKKKTGELRIQHEGNDFFTDSLMNMDRLIYSEDRERIRQFLDRDHLISELEEIRQLTQDYRMVIDGETIQYTRMKVTYSSDHSHFIICVENRDKDVRREQEYLAELSTANELARRDDLTHSQNKTAYHEHEKELQKKMADEHMTFGIVVCDINGLKTINDTEGHRAGDAYIISSCSLISHIFENSPVFRIGGDEFAIILQGEDYENRQALIQTLRKQVEDHIQLGEGPVIASGLGVYEPERDQTVEEVFNRADNEMYSDKSRLKELKLLQESHARKEKAEIRPITEERRNMVDALYKAFKVVSEGTYVYLCDMKYDFSRWSKAAVDAYGLPSAYMYGAGDLWEGRIHPEDREAYHLGIEEIFSGFASGHDMQYRVMRTNGEYDVCTCRGIVIRDPSGEPDYFVGTIRNHSIQGHMDTLTGLRNQYGFFEDLEGCIRRNAKICVALVGLSRFSEINEMYGYHYGNRVLQSFGRKAYETIGNYGHVYRIDGAKFAVISNSLSMEDFRVKYDRFREYMHEDFVVDGKKILVDLNCGALSVSNEEIDSQTVYACLNFAFTESKVRLKGDLCEFSNSESDDNYLRLEMLHAIRASIMHEYEGFYLLFQPVVDAETEQVIGAEALLRWKSDVYGLVPPDQFIPVLESDPLFPELGEWIIRESIISAKQILRKQPDFIINVNLSYTQLEKPDFADMVVRTLDDLEFPPDHLCLEVTERCRLLDIDLLKNVLTGLKSRGIQIALDDFGTGFSSIGILREIPVNIIKIDRSFVTAIEKNDMDRRIIKNIADLALIFSAKVCVEGIETAGMRDILKQYHVKSFQGYYYAKPLLLDQFLDWSLAR